VEGTRRSNVEEIVAISRTMSLSSCYSVLVYSNINQATLILYCMV
jgi:hypothetical protein